MKTRTTELDVDFIGGEEPLTKAQEQALSEYFKKGKLTTFKKISKDIKLDSIRCKMKAR